MERSMIAQMRDGTYLAEAAGFVRHVLEILGQAGQVRDLFQEQPSCALSIRMVSDNSGRVRIKSLCGNSGSAGLRMVPEVLEERFRRGANRLNALAEIADALTITAQIVRTRSSPSHEWLCVETIDVTFNHSLPGPAGASGVFLCISGHPAVTMTGIDRRPDGGWTLQRGLVSLHGMPTREMPRHDRLVTLQTLLGDEGGSGQTRLDRLLARSDAECRTDLAGLLLDSIMVDERGFAHKAAKLLMEDPDAWTIRSWIPSIAVVQFLIE